MLRAVWLGLIEAFADPLVRWALAALVFVVAVVVTIEVAT